jgi:hypothetical protein
VTCDQYANAKGCIGTAVSFHSSTLPYSGLPLGLVLTIGAMLIVIGAILLIGERPAR